MGISVRTKAQITSETRQSRVDYASPDLPEHFVNIQSSENLKAVDDSSLQPTGDPSVPRTSASMVLAEAIRPVAATSRGSRGSVSCPYRTMDAITAARSVVL